MGGRELSEYGLPETQTVENDRFARVYCREIDYDQAEQQAFVEQNVPLLTADQRKVHDCFCFMVDGDGGMVACYFWMLLVVQVTPLLLTLF